MWTQLWSVCMQIEYDIQLIWYDSTYIVVANLTSIVTLCVCTYVATLCIRS